MGESPAVNVRFFSFTIVIDSEVSARPVRTPAHPPPPTLPRAGRDPSAIGTSTPRLRG